MALGLLSCVALPIHWEVSGFKSSAKTLLPLAAPALTQCIIDPSGESRVADRNELPVAALSQPQLPYNPTQFTMVKGDFDGLNRSDIFFISNEGEVHVRISNGSNYDTYKKLLSAGASGTLTTGQYQ